MYKILRVLNNSAVLVIDLYTKQEIIFIGKGIGFGKRVNDNVSKFENSKSYFFEKENPRGNSIQMIKNIDGVYIEIASSIIQEAERVFDFVDSNILIPLADHIDFTIKRINNNVEIRNPFLRELKVLFESEYSVALKGKDIIKEKVNIDINDDEVGYLALHINSAVTNSDTKEGINTAFIVKESIYMIENLIGKKVSDNSLLYVRLITHIKFMLMRMKTEEKIDVDMSDYVISNFPESYKISCEVCDNISKILKKSITDIEKSYFAIYIERIKNI